MKLSKRFILAAALLLVVGSAASALLWWHYSVPSRSKPMTQTDVLAFALQHNPEFARHYASTMAETAEIKPIEPSHRIRVAVGWLGLPDEEQNGRVSDLIVAGLGSSENLEMVDRPSLNAVLKELSLSLSGLVRAQTAARAGTLLRADWFLLGTSATVNNRKYVLARLIDARTGAVRNLNAVPNDQGVDTLATRLASFVRDSRNDASAARARTLLAVGSFRDVGVNSRQAGFGDELRGHSLAVFQGNTNVILLERDCADLLLQEVELDLAGLTAGGKTDPPAPMLSAMWTLDGHYQPYEAADSEVELLVDLEECFRQRSEFTLRGKPDEGFFAQVDQKVNGALTGAPKSPMAPTLIGEVQHQWKLAGELMPFPPSRISTEDFSPKVYWAQYYRENAVARLEGAMRGYKTMLLLDPTNRLAKLCLAACLESDPIGRMAESHDYFRQVAESPVQDNLTSRAMADLAWSYRDDNPVESANWFHKTGDYINSHGGRGDDYIRISKDIETEVAIKNNPNSAPADLAEHQLFLSVRQCSIDITHTVWNSPSPAMDTFLGTFGADRAAGVQRLNELLPGLQQQFTNIAPHLLLCAFLEQTETNNPLLSKFEESLQSCAAHPDQMVSSGWYFGEVAYSASKWCLQHKQYALVPLLMDAKRRATAVDVDAGSTAFVFRGKKAPPSMKLSDVKLSTDENIILANAFVALEKWQDALDIMESFPSRPVPGGNQETWYPGTIPGTSSDIDALCRRKLGLPALPPDPRVFDLGKPCFGFRFGGTFAATPDGLWVVDGDRLIQLGFDLKTNLNLLLPNAGASVDSVCVGPSQIFLGTQGAGLFEYDKATGRFRHWTEKDGLNTDFILNLCIQRDSLWIGFGNALFGGAGGVARLNLASGAITTFTPSVASTVSRTSATYDPPTQAPRGNIFALAAAPDGDMFVSSQKGLQHYHAAGDQWEKLTVAMPFGMVCTADSLYTTVTGWPFYTVGQNLCPLQTMTLADQHWKGFGEAAAIPLASSRAIALNGEDIWLAGPGYIGVINPGQGIMRKFCYLAGGDAFQLAVGGVDVWVQLAGNLYRIPQSVAQ